MAIHADLTTAATHEEIERAVFQLYEMAGGYRAPNEAVRALLIRIGLANLHNIHDAFVIKARGGTDASGLSWPKLQPKTIAYSRRHPGVLFPGRKRAPYAPSWMLTEKQRTRWWKLYRQYGGTGPSGAGYHQRAAGTNPYAARVAWRILKAEGAKTLLGEYGGVQVEILRDKGLLLNSLTVGIPADSPTVSMPDVEDQVFRIERAAVIVGTNRKHAGIHHEGLGHVPQRRLWPAPRHWPSNWWSHIFSAAQQGCIDILVEILRGT